MKSKNFKIGHSDVNVMKQLELSEGIVPFLESQLLMRNALPDEQLDLRLKKANKLNLELKK
ncbi:hypothetical protein HY488_01060 [Candidatus Woesearchaeota archaeon]|nr:hypothetical protein [Candidatus Woesearchaeota archaeon]